MEDSDEAMDARDPLPPPPSYDPRHLEALLLPRKRSRREGHSPVVGVAGGASGPSPSSLPSSTMLLSSSPSRGVGVGAPAGGVGGEALFTADEVRAFLAQAIARRDAELFQHYDHHLRERLQEQFDMFARVNQECQHQQMRRLASERPDEYSYFC